MSSIKLIRISGIEPESIVDGEGIRYVIFTQGCPHHCPGCHNPQTHPFGGGKLVPIEDILDDISKRKNWIDGITISGGEPFCQIYQCALIAEKAHEMGLSVWWFGVTLVIFLKTCTSKASCFLNILMYSLTARSYRLKNRWSLISEEAVISE